MTTARPPTTTNRTPDSSRYARSSSNIEAEDISRPAPGGQAGLPVLHRCELGAGSGVGDEGGERSVQQPRDRDVVDLPSRGAGCFVGADAEADQYGLVGVGSAEVAGDGGEVRPAGHAVDECRPACADRSAGSSIRDA